MTSRRNRKINAAAVGVPHICARVPPMPRQVGESCLTNPLRQSRAVWSVMSGRGNPLTYAKEDTETVINALIKNARKLPQELYKSLTWDQGKELAAHKRS